MEALPVTGTNRTINETNTIAAAVAIPSPGASSQQHEPTRRHVHASAVPQTNTKALITTLLILGTYFVSYAPAILYQVLTCIDHCPYPLYDISYGRRVLFGAMTTLLLIAKSIVDPLIYSYRMNEIQMAISRYLSKRRSKTSSHAASMRTSQRFTFGANGANTTYQNHSTVSHYHHHLQQPSPSSHYNHNNSHNQPIHQSNNNQNNLSEANSSFKILSSANVGRMASPAPAAARHEAGLCRPLKSLIVNDRGRRSPIQSDNNALPIRLIEADDGRLAGVSPSSLHPRDEANELARTKTVSGSDTETVGCVRQARKQTDGQSRPPRCNGSAAPIPARFKPGAGLEAPTSG